MNTKSGFILDTASSMAPQCAPALPLLALALALALQRGGTVAAAAAPIDPLAVAKEYTHVGGGLTSAVMSSIISKLPPVAPPTDGVRGDELILYLLWYVKKCNILYYI
eukprot:SAG31_NODE_3261_length_4483_cov_3.272582_2_plen_108_part_00